MVNKTFVPSKGDIIWIDLEPTRGSEQAGTRPAVVLSHKEFNDKTGLALMCPVTSIVKGYPFEIPIESKKTAGVVLVDQIRSLDWRSRRIGYVETVSPEIMKKLVDRLLVLVLPNS